MKRALVLSGGSIKGAFQAGAICHLLEHGYQPNLAYGISAGALNAVFLADRSGRMARQGQPVDWKEVGRQLERFWVERVTGPGVVIDRRSWLSIGLAILGRRFDGLVDTGPLRRLVRREIDPENLKRSPLELLVGAVNLESGDIVFAGAADPRIVDYVIASTAIPISMPLADVGGKPFYDGGMRDIAPLGTAINARADDIVCVVCQPDRLDARELNRGHLPDLVSRVMDVVTSEIIQNDLKVVDRVNRIVRAEGGPVETAEGRTYREIPCTLIEPKETIQVRLESFTSDDIRKMLQAGRDAARAAWTP
jgi:NTE family protein